MKHCKNIETSMQNYFHLLIDISTVKSLKCYKCADIIRIEANGSYTVFYFSDGSKITDTRSLKSYQNILPSCIFFRAHSSHMVNSHYIDEYLYKEAKLVLIDKTKIPMSRLRLKDFREHISMFCVSGR